MKNKVRKESNLNVERKKRMKTQNEIERKIFLLSEEQKSESNLGKKSDLSFEIKALEWVLE